jgi:hypothetical protein
METIVMNKDELLFDLCKNLLADKEVVGKDDWSKVVIGGSVDGGSASLSGFCFDAQGDWEAAAPRNRDALALLRQLREAMADMSPDHKQWKACRIVIGANGKFAADFDYNDAARWAIAPATHAERLAEFAAQPPWAPGSG